MTSPAQPEGSAAPCLDVVLFWAAGWRVGFEARQVAALDRLAGEGECRPVEALLGLPLGPAPSGERSRLTLRASREAVTVAGPVEFASLPAGDLRRLPPLVAAGTRLVGLRALAVTGEAGSQRPILLFDATGLKSAGA
ncbi:MAG: hypothetical protein ACP59X_14420 [Solidesulfovibrio sp. DCME]|uniref:hypothetical protein n=1 Tax=Solidesulfovibrio sp. DCME TaxID=3447380 RepID=UPI003D0AE53C